MNVRVLGFVSLFVGMLISPYLVEPAYYGFLVAFAFLVMLQAHWNGVPTRLTVPVSGFALAFIVCLLTFLVVTFTHQPAPRDLLRDVGAIFAFFVGLKMFVAYRGEGLHAQCLSALSVMGVIVSVVTIAAAVMAYASGASAYSWRGEFVPWAHTWLPFAIVANVFLAQIDESHSTRYVRRTALCVAGTLASLSRTDVLLEAAFAAVLLFQNRHRLFYNVGGFTKLIVASTVLLLLAPLMFSLEVVQQRMERGVGENDQSLGWRFMEHVALLDHFLSASLGEWLFGFGLGARMPLPPGIVDFNDNTSIPHLHNSFGTLMLKFGIVGLLLLAWYLLRLWRKSRKLDNLPGREYRKAGRWIVLLCLGKALTLQGLTEWSHLVLFGIGCMLTVARPAHVFWIASIRRNPDVPVTIGRVA